MYRTVAVSAASVLLLFSMGVSQAVGDLDRKALKLIITGNTMEGRSVSPDAGYKLYFHPSGKWVRAGADGKIDSGKWRIDDKDALCMEPVVAQCCTVKERAEGQYDLYNPQGELTLTIDKVTLGNPDRLREPAAQ